jgi:hypothetical protein
MIDETPFGLPLRYMKVNATIRLIDGSGKTLRVVPFIFGSTDFVPHVLHLKWKEMQQIEQIGIFLDIDYDIVVMPMEKKAQGKGSFRLLQPWRVTQGQNGVLLDQLKYKHLVSPKFSEGFAVQVELNPDQTPRESDVAFVSLQLRLTGGFTDDGFTVNVGYGPVSAGAPVGAIKGRYLQDYEFKATIHIHERPEKSDPVNLPADLLTHIVYFDEPIRPGKAPGEDQPNLSATELRRLEDAWVKPLQSRAKELYWVISNGKCPIILSGYASTTGKPRHDDEMSDRRIRSVEEAIKDAFKSDKINIVPIPKGHGSATQRGVVAREKRVEIKIDRQDAERAIAANRGKI